MRGKGKKGTIFKKHIGITPAYAGKRADGYVVANDVEGSPPPMRGKGRFDFGILAGEGITPAYAGKRLVRKFPLHWNRDHPRLCGEKLNSAFAVLIVLGSPPPMRGKVFRHTHTQNRFRITPAYAGKSISAKNTSPRFKDHPRLCGEKQQRL